tara:strand:- start:2402 stop:2767 length:366 start_codon:yes stop_codon:yes gene_type:complete
VKTPTIFNFDRNGTTDNPERSNEYALLNVVTMSMLIELHEDAQLAFNEWLVDKPKKIKDIAKKVKPWFRYRIKETGQHCTVVSYFEDGTLKVNVDGHDLEVLDVMNQVNVFGINPDDLEAL